jgi:hypothetical protein
MASVMTAKPIPGRRKPSAAMSAMGALVLATVVVGVADAATAPIYKCVGNDLRLIYTDQPCKGGERLDVHAGDPDPVAVARLQSARDQLDRSAAARLVEERRAATQRDLAAWARRQREKDRSDADASDYADAFSPYDYSLPWYSGLVPMHPRPPPRPPPPPAAPPRHFAPSPPYVVPRS